MGLLNRILNRSKSHQPNAIELTVETAIKIIQDYGALLESATHAPGCVVDASNLPHPKQRIKQALIMALRSTTDPQRREQCKVGLIYLADWQEGVGVAPVGLDPRKLDSNATTLELAEQVLSARAGMSKWDQVVKAERAAVELELKKLGLL